MPYIAQDRRVPIDRALGSIPFHKDVSEPGDLTYLLYTAMARWVTAHRARGQNGYATISRAIACANDAANEFRRRVLDAAEDEAIARNGDINI
jgi:hypothetical protein